MEDDLLIITNILEKHLVACFNHEMVKHENELKNMHAKNIDDLFQINNTTKRYWLHVRKLISLYEKINVLTESSIAASCLITLHRNFSEDKIVKNDSFYYDALIAPYLLKALREINNALPLKTEEIKQYLTNLPTPSSTFRNIFMNFSICFFRKPKTPVQLDENYDAIELQPFLNN